MTEIPVAKFRAPAAPGLDPVAIANVFVERFLDDTVHAAPLIHAVSSQLLYDGVKVTVGGAEPLYAKYGDTLALPEYVQGLVSSARWDPANPDLLYLVFDRDQLATTHSNLYACKQRLERARAAASRATTRMILTTTTAVLAALAAGGLFLIRSTGGSI